MMRAFSRKSVPKDMGDRLAKIQVLIADEDRRISSIVCTVLSSLGFKSLHVAEDGTEALRILEGVDISLIITDWEMSPMDGMTLVQYLRRSPKSPNRFIPIIMLTANSEQLHVEAARDAGVTEFVVKPFTAQTLCDRIEALIDDPRSFIMCKAFVGPERRRKKGRSPEGDERRKKKPS